MVGQRRGRVRLRRRPTIEGQLAVAGVVLVIGSRLVLRFEPVIGLSIINPWISLGVAGVAVYAVAPLASAVRSELERRLRSSRRFEIALLTLASAGAIGWIMAGDLEHLFDLDSLIGLGGSGLILTAAFVNHGSLRAR